MTTTHLLGESRNFVILGGSMTCGYVPCSTALFRLYHTWRFPVSRLWDNEKKNCLDSSDLV